MERYSLEQAQEEAVKIQEIVASGATASYRRAERMVEEGVPEIQEKENLQVAQDEKVVANEHVVSRKKEDEEKIAALREEILNTGKKEDIKQLGNIEGKNPNEATNEAQNEDTKKFERNFKTGLENISSQSKTMLDALYERQQERLTPLQSNENFQMMASSIRNLKNFEGKIDIDSISKTTEDINKLSRLFDDIKIKPSGQIKEKPQNLEKLAFGAKKLSASCEESKNGLPIEMSDKQMEEKSKELRKSLQRLSEQTQKLWLFAVKLRESTR